MGTFLHSLHVRSSDPAHVKRKLEEAGQAGLQAWVAPAAGNWVTVLPKEMGDVLVLGPVLSAAGKTDVLATLVHDSDVFCYLLFRGGTKIEEYESLPDYFEPKTPPTPRITPEHVLALLPKAEAAPAVVTLLTGEPPVFAQEVLVEFARYFALKYAHLTYDDLAGKDAVVSRRRDFRHVPDLLTERSAKQATKKQQREAKRQWRKKGHLVFDSELTRRPAAYSQPFEVFAAAPERGFLALHFGACDGLLRWDPPADPLPIAKLPQCTGFQCGPVLSDGRLIVAPSNQGLGVIDLTTGDFQLRHAIAHGWPMVHDATTDLVYLLVFGRGSVDSDRLTAVRLRDGRVEFTIPLTRGVQEMLIHPTRPELVCIEQRKLRVFDKRTGAARFEADFYNETLEPKKRAQWRAAGFENPGNGRVPDREIFAREDFCALAFDAPGEWLIAGTSEGLRFFRYEELFRQPDRMPPPAIAVETSHALQDYRSVNNLLLHEGGTEVVYTCGDDSIRSFDWARGVDRELKASAEPRRIFSLIRSSDGQQLAAVLVYRGDDWKNHQGETWVQVWDYAALRGPATPSARPPSG